MSAGDRPVPATRGSIVGRIVAADLCSGCGLCAGLSDGRIAMADSADGYSRPSGAALDPLAERKVARACPGAAVAPWPADGAVHPIWGPHRAVASGHAGDPEVRHRASSGGVISAILIHALEQGLIDGVLQIAADDDRPVANKAVISRSAAEILAAAGSRYAPSSPLADIETILAGGGRYAFVGKPCDVSALRLLGTADPRVAERFAFMLSFFCAGIPSYAGIDAILDTMGSDRRRLRAFRYRGEGWPGYAKATHDDGSIARLSYAASWGDHLSKTLQFRCKICPDAIGGAADVACADAWYGDEAGYPKFEEEEGRSAILMRTALGETLVAGAVARGALAISPLAIGELDMMQPSQARRKRQVLSRFAAIAVMGRPRPRAKGLALGRAARLGGAGESIRGLGGLLRRLMRQRRAR